MVQYPSWCQEKKAITGNYFYILRRWFFLKKALFAAKEKAPCLSQGRAPYLSSEKVMVT